MAVAQTRRARAARRRKRRVDAADNDLTAEQWEELKREWGGCAYCTATDSALQKDCVQPISSKSNSEVTSWMRRKRLDERAFLTQYVHVRQALGIL